MKVVIAVLVTSLGLASALYFSSERKREQLTVIRMTFPVFKSFQSLDVDPARVQEVKQANLVRNLYARLVEFDQKGRLYPAAAESFSWKGNSLIFSIRSNMRTVDGSSITPKDVELSLKRILVLKSNSHGNLGLFLCSSKKLSSVDEECDGISSDDKNVYLNTKDQAKSAFLLPLLASADFSIIPRGSVNWNSPKLEIVDYRNTSGAFYLDKDSQNGAFEFAANPGTFYLNEKAVNRIQFVPAYGEDALNLLKESKVDLVPTMNYTTTEQLGKLKNEVPDLSVHETKKIGLRAVFFTKKGLERLTDQERLIVGVKIRDQFNFAFPEQKVDPSVEFFPTFGDGSLDKDQLETLNKQISRARNESLDREILVAAPPGRRGHYENAFSSIRNLTFKEYESAPWTVPYDEQPDIYVGYTDSAFFEDISLLSYNIHQGSFGLSAVEGEKWLLDYMETGEREKRVEKLRKLQFNFLSSGKIVPIGHIPFFAVARGNLKLNMSPFYAGTPLWQIQTY